MRPKQCLSMRMRRGGEQTKGESTSDPRPSTASVAKEDCVTVEIRLGNM